MKNTHTPGPWQRHKSESDGCGYMITVPHHSGLGHLANVYSEENSRLIAAAPDLSAFAKECAGDDGYLLAQIATFLGGVMDNATLNSAAKNVGEGYYRTLLELSEKSRAAIAKATGETP